MLIYCKKVTHVCTFLANIYTSDSGCGVECNDNDTSAFSNELTYHNMLSCIFLRILGRRKTALIGIVLVIIGGFFSSFSTSYLMFVASRFLVAIGTAGTMQASGVWCKENYKML